MSFLGLVWSNLMRNKLRTILTTLSVFVALFLFCALRGIVDTLDDSIKVGSEQRLITRNKVSLVFDLPVAHIERIRALDGVRSVTWSNWFGGLDPVDAHDFYQQFAVDPTTYFPMYSKDFMIADGSVPPSGTPVPAGVEPKLAAFLNERTAAVVGEGLMKRKGWKLDQTIRLNGTIYPGSWPMTIRATYRPLVKALDSETIYFHWNYLYENSNRQARAGFFILDLTDPSRASSVAKAVDAMFENSSDATRTETERAFQAGFVSMMGNIPFVINFVGLAVAFSIFLVAIVTMMMAIRERTNESGVMKTLGFEDGTLFRLVMAEAAAITLTGGIAGAVAAKLLLERSGFRIPGFPPLTVHWETVALGVGVAVLMGVVSGLLPAWQTMKLRIVDALRRVA